MAVDNYRIKKMAGLCADLNRVLDIGWAKVPNPYLHNPELVGLDLQDRDKPPNYAQCLTGDAMELPHPFSPGSFDGVIAGEIIEHVERPVDFLRRIIDTLAPGGRIVLSTPNPNSPFERLLTITLSRRYFYTQEHICLYPQRWLIRMMEVAGFTEVKLISGGMKTFLFGHIPFPRPWCYHTIATGLKP